jgi:hypothetical protein
MEWLSLEGVNWAAVGVAFLATFTLGWAWYSNAGFFPLWVRLGRISDEDMQKANILADLPRTWADADRFVYDAHKGMWAHHNKLSHSIV